MYLHHDEYVDQTAQAFEGVLPSPDVHLLEENSLRTRWIDVSKENEASWIA